MYESAIINGQSGGTVGRETRDGGQFTDSLARGAGYATGAAIVGAIVTTVLAPVPGSAELGAAIGSVVGGVIGGSHAAG